MRKKFKIDCFWMRKKDNIEDTTGSQLTKIIRSSLNLYLGWKYIETREKQLKSLIHIVLMICEIEF